MKVSYAPEKLYRSNKVLNYILTCNENVTKDIFREGQLQSLSTRDHKVLLSNELLSEAYQDPQRSIFYDENKTAYKVRREDDGYFGYRLRGDGDSRIKLGTLETKFLRFERDKFIELIQAKNSLTGKYVDLTERMFFAGYHKQKKGDIGVVLGLFPSDAICEKELLSLPSRVTGAKKFLVLCPQYVIGTKLNTKLADKGIFCYQFNSIFDDDLKIDFSVVKSEAIVTSKFDVPEISSTEQKHSKDYPRKDVIEFTDNEIGTRSYEVLINGQSATLEYSLFGLVLFMAMALKKGTDKGWVSLEMALDQELVRDQPHFHRIISELVKKLVPVEDNKIKIIENLKRQSKYRISTMPSRIIASPKWLSAKYKKIKAEIVKERAQRDIQNERAKKAKLGK